MTNREVRTPIARLIAGLCFLLALFSSGTLTEAAYFPASPGCTLQIAVSQTASTDLHTFTNNAYICYTKLISATAQHLSLVQGTGTTCGTSMVALDGSTTAANGNYVGVNGGWSLTIPSGSYIKTTTTAQHLCLLQDGTGLVSGVIGYLDAP